MPTESPGFSITIFTRWPFTEHPRQAAQNVQHRAGHPDEKPARDSGDCRIINHDAVVRRHADAHLLLPHRHFLQYRALEFQNLSLPRLDRLNRFIRLAASTGWQYEELDWALASIAATQIDKAAIKALADISRLVQQTGLTVTELAAFWGPLKTTGKGDGPAPADLFDRVFNAPAVLAGQDPYTSATPIFDPSRPLTWDPSATTGQDGVIRARLTAALTVGDDDLTRLAGYVRAITGTDPPRPDPGRTPDPEPRRHPLLMDLGNLSWLYRLAAAARIFRLTVEEYLVLLRLMYHPGQDTPEPGSLVPAVDTVAAQRTRVEWFNRTAFTVYSALYVLEGIRAPQFRPPYTPDDLGPAITSLATAAEGARLTAESFTYGPITPARSQEVFHGLVTGKVITELGVLLDNGTRSQQAAAMFPLHPDSFTSAEWSQAAFAELKAADPPCCSLGRPARASALPWDRRGGDAEPVLHLRD